MATEHPELACIFAGVVDGANARGEASVIVPDKAPPLATALGDVLLDVIGWKTI